MIVLNQEGRLDGRNKSTGRGDREKRNGKRKNKRASVARQFWRGMHERGGNDVDRYGNG